MLGVAGGTWLDRGIPEKEWPRLASRVFVWEKILLSLLAVAWAFILHRAVAADLLLLVLLAGVMGLQSAALHRLRAPGVATTAVTGTLTALSSNLTALALAHEAGDGGRARFQALVLILYAVGALGGALLMAATPWLAGALPAVVALLVLPGNSRRSRPPN
jgi:uncharacterized membrane protein YoaK (UPF0700 family)